MIGWCYINTGALTLWWQVPHGWFFLNHQDGRRSHHSQESRSPCLVRHLSPNLIKLKRLKLLFIRDLLSLYQPDNLTFPLCFSCLSICSVERLCEEAVIPNLKQYHSLPVGGERAAQTSAQRWHCEVITGLLQSCSVQWLRQSTVKNMCGPSSPGWQIWPQLTWKTDLLMWFWTQNTTIIKRECCVS